MEPFKKMLAFSQKYAFDILVQKVRLKITLPSMIFKRYIYIQKGKNSEENALIHMHRNKN